MPKVYTLAPSYTHTLLPGDLWENGYGDYLVDYYRSSPFAYAKLTTEARVLTVNTYTNVHGTFPAMSQAYVRVDDADYTTISMDGSGANSETIALPAGEKTVQIVAGLQSRPSSSIIGTYLVSVSANAPITILPPETSDRVLIYGDSISVGANASVPPRDGWVVRLRKLRGNVMLEGYGYRALYNDASTAGSRSTFADLIQDFAPSIIWFAIGTNDYGLEKWSAASFGSAYGSLLDSINSRLPSAHIYCQSPITRGDEGSNSYGSTLDDYRAQISAAAAARPGFCTYVNGSAWSITLDTDELHPTSTGHSEYYLAVKDVLIDESTTSTLQYETSSGTVDAEAETSSGTVDIEVTTAS